MKTEESKRFVLVSIFITLAIAILVAGIFMLGGQQKRFVKSVQAIAVFKDVSGLKVGNNIWFSGVKIGTVKDIELTGNKQVRVTMNIEEASHQFIRKDAKVRLGSESLIGNKIIEVIGGTTQAPAIENNDQLQVENTTDTDAIMATLQENNQNLLAITSDFKILSRQMVEGKGPAGKLLSDSLMGEKFNAIVNNLHKVSETSNQASQAIAQFSQKLNRKDGLANQLLTDTIVFNRIKASSLQLNQTTAAATQMAQNLQQASEKLEKKDNALGVLLNDEQFASQLKNTMSNLDKSSVTLDENMKALQSNFLFRGYFKKQEKEKTKLEKDGLKQK
jgi:phospholipid/cholesterol/gamma-HCH transport system substrate-binding protein